MCEYCDEYGENHRDFFRLKADFGLLGEKEIIADIFTSCIDNKAYIDIALSGGKYGDNTYIGEKEIHYCPWCGRELGGER